MDSEQRLAVRAKCNEQARRVKAMLSGLKALALHGHTRNDRIEEISEAFDSFKVMVHEVLNDFYHAHLDLDVSHEGVENELKRLKDTNPEP